MFRDRQALELALFNDPNEEEKELTELKKSLSKFDFTELSAKQNSYSVKESLADFDGWQEVGDLIDHSRKQRFSFEIEHVDELCSLHQPIIEEILSLQELSKSAPLPYPIVAYIGQCSKTFVTILQAIKAVDSNAKLNSIILDVLPFPSVAFTLILDYLNNITQIQQFCFTLLTSNVHIYPELTPPNSRKAIIKPSKKKRAPQRFFSGLAFNEDTLMMQCGTDTDAIENLQGLVNLGAQFYLAEGKIEKAKGCALEVFFHQSKLHNPQQKQKGLTNVLNAYVILAECAFAENQWNLVIYYAQQAKRSISQLFAFNSLAHDPAKRLEMVLKRLLSIHIKSNSYLNIYECYDSLKELVQQRRDIILKNWRKDLSSIANLPIFFGDNSPESQQVLASFKCPSHRKLVDDASEECTKLLDHINKQIVYFQKKHFETLQKQFIDSSAKDFYDLKLKSGRIILAGKKEALKQSIEKRKKLLTCVEYQIDSHHGHCLSMSLQQIRQARIMQLFSQLANWQTNMIPETTVEISFSTQPAATIPDIKSETTAPEAKRVRVAKESNSNKTSKWKIKQDKSSHTTTTTQSETKSTKVITSSQRILYPLSNSTVPHGIYYAEIDDAVKQALGEESKELEILHNKFARGKLLRGNEDGDGIKHCVDDYSRSDLSAFEFKVRMTHGLLGDIRIYGYVKKPDDEALTLIGSSRFNPTLIRFTHVVTNAHTVLHRHVSRAIGVRPDK